jgi:AraC family transcriptional regulator
MMEHMPLSLRGDFHGRTLISRGVAGFMLREMVHEPGTRIPRHSHERAHVAFVLRGAFTERCERKELACRPLSVSFLAPGLSHSDDFRERVHCLLVEIAAERLERLRAVLPMRDPVFLQGGRAAWLLMRLYQEAREADAASALAVEGLALEVLAAVSREQSAGSQARPPRWLTRAKELIDARFRETTTHDELANAVGVHPVHLASQFRKHFKRTIGQHVRWLRIEHASRQLAASDAPLAEIALSSGFADQSHFSKVFKRLAGTTPSQFRVNLRRV